MEPYGLNFKKVVSCTLYNLNLKTLFTCFFTYYRNFKTNFKRNKLANYVVFVAISPFTGHCVNTIFLKQGGGSTTKVNIKKGSTY